MYIQELLTEAKGDLLLDKIKKDCALYLSINPLEHHKPLLRGIQDVTKSHLRKVKKNRRPVDTPAFAHFEFNQFFKKKFGKPYRSISVFCTGSDDLANNWGNVFVIFPKGKFNCCWSPDVRDLYSAFFEDWEMSLYDMFVRHVLEYPKDKSVSISDCDKVRDMIAEEENIENSSSPEAYDAMMIRAIRYSLSQVQYLENERFFEAVDSGHEIMIDCEYYYAVNFKTFLSWKI